MSGDIDPRRTRSDARAPDSWSDAFAALPLETSESGWRQLSAALDGDPTPRPIDRRAAQRWPYALALAAILATVAVVPFVLQGPHQPAQEAAPSVSTTGSAVQPTLPDLRTKTSDGGHLNAPTVIESRAPIRSERASAPADATIASGSAEAATAGTVRPLTREKQRTTPRVTPSTRDTLIASAASQRRTTTAGLPIADTRSYEAALTKLLAESARLEAVTAELGDERMATGAGVVLLDAHVDRVAALDAMLTQPALDDAQRLVLWQQRVAAMRELAAMTTVQRWLSARGESYEGGIARVD